MFEISDISIRMKTVEDLTENIINEINKCQILCKNCHSLEHIDIVKYNNLLPKIKDNMVNMRNLKKPNHEEILSRYKNGERIIDIANSLGINKSTVHTIVNNPKYKK